jgi:hypothetical protein
MADADALLIRKLIVAALEGGDAHFGSGKHSGRDAPDSIREILSFEPARIRHGIRARSTIRRC